MNTVELIGYYGGDRAHALAAWTSTSRDLPHEKRGRIPALLKMLAEAGHHTPFERSTLHFLVRVETATHIQMLKHRIGVSINGESARYKELKTPTFHVPEDWTARQRIRLMKHNAASLKLYQRTLKELTPLIGRQRAKESSRFFLPYSNELTLDVSFNWRSFAHFYGLRASDHAQREISNVAVAMLNLVRGIKGSPFKHTIAAFGY